MIKNYFKIALRNLRRNKTFSSINLLGLALGLAVFILIMLWVQYEMNYDGFHKDKERIAAVMTNLKFENGETQTFPAVPVLLAGALQKDIPSVEYAASASWGDQRQFAYGEKKFAEYGLHVSPEFLKIFSFPLLKGSATTALTEPHTVLLTEKLARKYFGTDDPIGKTITIEQNTPYKVTGVLKDVPDNATLSFDFLMPVKDYVEFTMGGVESWDIPNMRAYVKLREGTDFNTFNKSFAGILAKYTNKFPNATNFAWQLKDWYLRFDFKDGKYAGGGRITYVKMFIIIAIFILLLACINFMNLSTARATQRAKEVGVRKAIGAAKSSLVKQFMSESVLLALLSGIIAVGLVALVLPSFNTAFRKHISIDFTNIGNIITFCSIIIITGLLAGAYPALVLSRFKPVTVFKNNVSPASGGSSWLRKGLVVTQFAVSVLLIIGTITVSQQVNYLKNRDLGYNKNQLIWFPSNITIDKQETTIQELLKVPGVTHASQASVTFTQSNNRGSEVSWPGKEKGQDVFFSFIAAGNDIVQTMGLTMKEGRAFYTNSMADTASVLLNEEAVKRMGLKNPVGQLLQMPAGAATVVGVIKDFHFESLHNPIAPSIIMCRPQWTWNVYVRTDGKDIQKTIAGIEQVYKTMAPGFVFDYNFQDKEYERLYRSETQTGTLVNWFAFFAIFISCLGLLGLTAYTVERKTKEVGIRKVLGASVSSIVLLMSKQFIWLVLIAVVIAAAPAYYFMNNWLGNYAYRISLGWPVFALAGIIAVVIAVLTISFQSVKAALANPVAALRND
jgi:putative ABC transport system permease protein